MKYVWVEPFFLPGTLVTVMVNGFWLACCWLPDPDGCWLAGVTETLGGICCFFEEDGSNGSENVFCSLAAERPITISSNFRRRFSLPPLFELSSTGYKKYWQFRLVIDLRRVDKRNRKLTVKLTQLFFFINLVNISSSLPLPWPNGEPDDFGLDIEKSCTSDRSTGLSNISAMFIFGKLWKLEANVENF